MIFSRTTRKPIKWLHLQDEGVLSENLSKLIAYYLVTTSDRLYIIFSKRKHPKLWGNGELLCAQWRRQWGLAGAMAPIPVYILVSENVLY